MKKISVVIPCYNNFGYIYETLESVLYQDYPSVEIVVTDDGSIAFPDFDIRSFIQERLGEKKYTILHSEHNCGTVRNLNKALKHLKGDYILFLAADDALFDNHVLSRYIEYLDNEAEVFVTQVYMCDNKLQNVKNSYIGDSDIKLLQCGTTKAMYTRMAWTCFLPASGMLYKREIFDREQFDETYFLVEDWSYYFHLIREGTKFKYLNFVSAKHRDGGVSHSKNSKSLVQQKYHEDIYIIQQREILAHKELIQEEDRKSLFWKIKKDSAKYIIKYQMKDYTFEKKIIWIVSHPIIIPIMIEYMIKCIFRFFKGERENEGYKEN